MEIRVSHSLPAEEAVERLSATAARQEIEFTRDPAGLAGTMSRATGLGTVRASWQLSDTTLVVVVEQRPAFLPEETVRRVLEQGLRDALA